MTSGGHIMSVSKNTFWICKYVAEQLYVQLLPKTATATEELSLSFALNLCHLS